MDQSYKLKYTKEVEENPTPRKSDGGYEKVFQNPTYNVQGNVRLYSNRNIFIYTESCFS